MKPKHYVAMMAVLGSLMWFAMMTASHIETLTTPQARLMFIIAFIIAFLGGVMGLLSLFTQAFRKEK